ncbi:hypothetical protein CCH79_00009252 [Gambusia affinis]|uniref:Uncharacterized protein n=1 Tax=Gambusia affinis TaxID=33528 RepID=A0A315W4B8_GAMAF|nr:hypothetical protein CCH79_00009252 [Gambusia affinis]
MGSGGLLVPISSYVPGERRGHPGQVAMFPAALPLWEQCCRKVSLTASSWEYLATSASFRDSKRGFMSSNMAAEREDSAFESMWRHFSTWFDVESTATIAGGSLAMASQRNPNKLLLLGCACSNLLGLLGSLLGFGIYIYVFNTAKNREPCSTTSYSHYRCYQEELEDYTSSLTLQLLLYDTVTVVLHFLFCWVTWSRGFVFGREITGLPSKLTPLFFSQAPPDNSSLNAELSAQPGHRR